MFCEDASILGYQSQPMGDIKRKQLGNGGEVLAQRYLAQNGYAILACNYRTVFGEIDIIAQQGDIISFVEVKTNRQQFQGNFNPESRVNHTKLQKIYKGAMWYLSQYKREVPWQIDIIAITLDQVRNKAKLQHFKQVSVDF